MAKRSVGKPGRGGRKWAARQLDEHGHRGRRGDHHERRRATRWPGTGPAAAAAAGAARRDRRPGAAGAARERHRQALAELPAARGAAVPRLPGHPDRLPAAGRGREPPARQAGEPPAGYAAAVRRQVPCPPGTVLPLPGPVPGGGAPGGRTPAGRPAGWCRASCGSDAAAWPRCRSRPVPRSGRGASVSSSSSWASRMRWPVSQRSGVVPVSGRTGGRRCARTCAPARPAGGW